MTLISVVHVENSIVAVMGVLFGGHIFVYDVCEDDLVLIKGRPELQQLLEDEPKHLETSQHGLDQMPTDEKFTWETLDNSSFQNATTIIQSSLKVNIPSLYIQQNVVRQYIN